MMDLIFIAEWWEQSPCGVAWVTNDTPCKGGAFITRGELGRMPTGKLRRLARLR